MGNVKYFNADAVRDGEYGPVLKRIADLLGGPMWVFARKIHTDHTEYEFENTQSSTSFTHLDAALHDYGLALHPRVTPPSTPPTRRADALLEVLVSLDLIIAGDVRLAVQTLWAADSLRNPLGISAPSGADLPAAVVVATGPTPRWAWYRAERLTESAQELWGLRGLYVLSIRGAPEGTFETLPSDIAHLQEIRSLDLSENNLRRLPETMRNLTQLRELFLHGNDALKIPAEILGPRPGEGGTPAKPADILDYYFRTREGARPLNEAKLILVGRGGVGKTTLIHRLTTGKFSNPKKTEGINIKEWPLALSPKEKVQLNVWDFGGQEIMHSTHQFFLTERSLYLLVLSGREGHEDEDAEYWLKLIQSFGGESPVIVVLNKQGEHPFDVNRGGLLQKYPNVKSFVATECKNGGGIGELRKTIKRETDGLEGLRAKFPAQWFHIKDRLGGMKENYLTFERYREICGELGEKESEAQEDLAGYLHTLGIALNYCDDPRLRHLHVLNPRWVVKGIYRIINARTLAERHGELHEGDLKRILPSRAYPREMHGYLVELMKKFELCFSLPEEGHFLVPDLLKKEQADAAKGFNEEECLHFRYDYGATPIPEGLLPRFIVRTHALSRELPRWRTGVVLEFEGNRALVRADRADKKVFISISGPAAGRRRLLAIVRSDFDRIHSDIKKLKPTELIAVPGHPDVTVKHEHLVACENSGEPTVQVDLGGRIENMAVAKLLSSVDVERAEGSAVPVFISYAHKDERFREDLEAHLKLLQRQGLIEMWHDRRIGPGKDWPEEIDKNLERAGIILLLISADFFNSDYCCKKEIPKALELRRERKADVIPVVVRSVNWKASDLAGLQALPKGAKPIDEWDKPDKAWSSVAAEIEKVARKRSRAKRARAR